MADCRAHNSEVGGSIPSPAPTPMITTKVKVLRTVHRGELYLLPGTTREIPADLAKELAKGKSPAVEILKEKA